tara:strand:+ start:11803 stop:12303 length:501 start_codon:yes stop_codon:yes gene_type:complete
MAALTPNLLLTAAGKASCASEFKKITGKDRVKYLKEAVAQVVGDLLSNDKSLHDTLKKTKVSTTGKARLAQLNPNLRRMMGGAKSFGCFWDTANPFIVYDNSVWDLSSGTLKADVRDAMISYSAFKIGDKIGKKSKIKALTRARISKPAVNLAAFNTKMSAIRAAN